MTVATIALHVWFIDNDSVRYALIRASGSGGVAVSLLRFHLKDEANRNSLIWFLLVCLQKQISATFLRGLSNISFWNNHFSAMKWHKKNYTRCLMKFICRCEIGISHPQKQKKVCAALVSTELEDEVNL